MAREIISFGLGPGTKTGNTAYEGGIKINKNFEELYTFIEILSNISIVTENNGFSLVDNDLTINANWEWLIKSKIFTNPGAVVFSNIPLSASGKRRLVYVVPNNENSFTMLSGLEVAGVPQPPELPNGGMYVTFFEVNDTEIGEASEGYNGDNTITLNEKINQLAVAVKALEDYKKSQAEDFWNYYDAQEVNNELIITSSTCSINLTGSLVELHALIYNIFLFMPADGNLAFIKNSQANSILIKHEAGDIVDRRYVFSFPDGQDLEVLPNQIVAFKIRKIGNNDGKIEFVGASQSVDESNLMHLTGDETVDDVKTFLKPIIIPEAIEPEHAVPLGQMEATDAQVLADAKDYADTKEDAVNKTSSLSGKEASNSWFPSTNGLTSWLKNFSSAWFGAHSTEVADADTLLIGKSGVLGTRTYAQIKMSLATVFAKKYGTRTVLSGTAIDWGTDTDTYTKTLTANTTLTDVNLPTGTNTRTIVLSIDGAFTLTVPAYWKNKGGVYSATKVNQIVLQCVNGNLGSERVNYVINPDL